MATAPPLLALRGLAHHYRGGHGVGPVSFRLPEGVHGLLGPNGSGKTTLIQTLLGFLPPTAGSGHVLGQKIGVDRYALRQLVGFMPEDDVAAPGLNASQTVRLAAELHGMAAGRAHEAAAEAMHAVGLGNERYQKPHRLTNGQRQRMKLAAAIVHAPRLLILDEPTSALDHAGRKRMLALIEEISREASMSVLLSTHILPDVEAVCDDAVVLADGRYVATEAVRGRKAAKVSARRKWWRVSVLGDPKRFIALCKRRRVQFRVEGDVIELVSSGPTHILRLARDSRVVLSRMLPDEGSAERAILERLEVHR